MRKYFGLSGILLVSLLTLLQGYGASDVAQAKSKYQKSKLTNDESEALADRRHLLLSTGEDKTVDLDFDFNEGPNGIRYGNPSIVSHTPVKVGDKRQIVFTPLKAGETTVTVRDVSGVIRVIFIVRVTGTNLLRIAQEIRLLLRDIEGVEIRIVGPKIIVEGEILVPADYGRLLAVIGDKTYQEFVLNLAVLSPLAMQVMAKKIQEDISTFAPDVKTRVVNGMIFLEGTTSTLDAARRAAEVAKLYMPDLKPETLLGKSDPGGVQRAPPRGLIQNFIVVNPPPPRKQEKLIRVTVHFVELKKDYNKIFGFKWEPGFTANPQIEFGQTPSGGAGATGPTLSGTISNLLPKLQSSQTAGYARVLKTGTVIVRSGFAAKLNEQTEFPFPQTGPQGQLSTASKAVGLALGVTPSIVGETEDILLELDMDQTSLVGRGPTPGAPPVTASHKVKTNIYVKSSESAAVAGIVSSDIGTDFNKDPPTVGTFAQGTDPLFILLHSKSFRKQKSQFVIFVTPQIIENASEGTEDLKRNFRVKVK